MNEEAVPGVYLRLADGKLRLMHAYLDEYYELIDIVEFFDLGVQSDARTVVMDRRALRTLKTMADAESFDHAAGFISMCLELAAVDLDPQIESLEFVTVG